MDLRVIGKAVDPEQPAVPVVERRSVHARIPNQQRRGGREEPQAHSPRPGVPQRAPPAPEKQRKAETEDQEDARALVQLGKAGVRARGKPSARVLEPVQDGPGGQGPEGEQQRLAGFAARVVDEAFADGEERGQDESGPGPDVLARHSPPGDQRDHAEHDGEDARAGVKARVAAGDQREHGQVERVAVVLRPGAGEKRLEQGDGPAHLPHLVRQVEEADVVIVRVGVVPSANPGDYQIYRHAGAEQQRLAAPRPGSRLQGRHGQAAATAQLRS